jgi:hypothetical protein
VRRASGGKCGFRCSEVGDAVAVASVRKISNGHEDIAMGTQVL